MNLRPALAALASVLGIGCAHGFTDTTVNGVPNLVEIAPRLWRSGQPADADAWRYVASRISEPGRGVTVVKLNDDAEGSDEPAAAFVGWTLVKAAIPPEDDKPWTVLAKPSRADVQRIVDTIATAYEHGDVVLWHCSHGRDRTSLTAALVGMRLLGWSKSQAWDDMIARGFRWELPDLDAYWLEDVR